MSTIVVETSAPTWALVVETLGHSLFFAQAFWWFSIDEFFSSIAMFQMALFSYLYHLCVLDIAPDPSHVAFFHGLDYTGIFGLTNALFFELIGLPFQFAGPLWMLLQTFTIPANWILYSTGYLVFSYAVIFAVSVLHKKHTDERELPWIYSFKYWYIMLAGIVLLMAAITTLYLGGNPGDGQYEIIHGGVWHFVAQPPIAIIMIAIRWTKAKSIIPFFFVFQKKTKKQ
jgi:hypothetical protein